MEYFSDDGERSPFDNQGVDGFGDALISAQSGTPYDGEVSAPLPAVPASTPPSMPTPTAFPSIQQAIANVTGAAMAVLQVQQAYQAIKKPPIRTADISSVTGTSKTIGTDGYLTVRNAAGQSIGREMPTPGVPYALPNGTVVVNNGNGTFSRILPSGAKTTVRYGAPASTGGGKGSPGFNINPFAGGFSSNAAVIVGVVGLLGAAFYFANRRGRA